MTERRTHLIAVAGASGSGKTVLASALAKRLGGEVFPLDSYYRDLSALSSEQLAAWNFDSPDALEWPLIRRHLREVLAGATVPMPVYDFATHRRTDRVREVFPGGWLIVEGLFALYDPVSIELADLRVFVDLTLDVCLARRLARDTIARGRTAESITAQYHRDVVPMYHRHIWPSRLHADKIVDGQQAVEESVNLIMEQLVRMELLP